MFAKRLLVGMVTGTLFGALLIVLIWYAVTTYTGFYNVVYNLCGVKASNVVVLYYIIILILIGFGTGLLSGYSAGTAKGGFVVGLLVGVIYGLEKNYNYFGESFVSCLVQLPLPPLSPLLVFVNPLVLVIITTFGGTLGGYLSSRKAKTGHKIRDIN